MLGKTFPRGGTDIPHRKSGTEQKPIVVMPAPEEVVIPLSQHIGAPAKAAVAVGDTVLVGQLIGEPQGFISAAVHASVSGKVKAIQNRCQLDGRHIESIVIENDGADKHVDGKGHSLDKLSVEKLRTIAKDAGLVGMGGAGFPTNVKLSPPTSVDAVIVNGAECEPYLTCDHRLMVERAADMVFGLKAAMKAVGAARGYIGIEVNKPDAIEAVQQAIDDPSALEVVALKVHYPQGAEKQLIKAVVNREVPSGELPSAVGCLVQNVHTLISFADALLRGVPLYERVLTVSGKAVVDPKNISARVGTKAADIVEFCGGLFGEPAARIAGGPMTGPYLECLEGPVVKATSGLLFLTEDEVGFDENRACIRCARCVDYCPIGLTPNVLGLLSDKGRIEEAGRWNVADCIECSVCSYVCPSKRALVTWIKQGKQDFMALQREQQAKK